MMRKVQYEVEEGGGRERREKDHVKKHVSKTLNSNSNSNNSNAVLTIKPYRLS
jgi:hypothetical protein